MISWLSVGLVKAASSGFGILRILMWLRTRKRTPVKDRFHQPEWVLS